MVVQNGSDSDKAEYEAGQKEFNMKRSKIGPALQDDMKRHYHL